MYELVDGRSGAGRCNGGACTLGCPDRGRKVDDVGQYEANYRPETSKRRREDAEVRLVAMSESVDASEEGGAGARLARVGVEEPGIEKVECRKE